MVPAQNLLRAEPETNFRLRRRRRIAHMAQILLLARRVVAPGETERKYVCVLCCIRNNQRERESDRVDLFNGVSYKGIESEFIYVVDRVA